MGPLAPSAFATGSAATAAAHPIVYDSGTGALLDDEHGNGAAMQFAGASRGLALTNAQFQVSA